MNNDHPILEMILMTGAGWTISLASVESVAKIVSLLVPTILSILIFIRNNRKK